MRYFFYFWLIAFLLANGSFVQAQDNKTIAANKLTPDLLFSHYTSRDGLPDNRIRTVFQDKKGFLWIGTMNGISRYDGYTFKKYYKSHAAGSISGSWSHVICEDPSANIWVGTLSGLNLFDVKTEQFTSFRHIPGEPNSLLCDRITALQADRSGKLWIGTEQGLATYRPADKKFHTYEKYPFNRKICKIIPSADDQIWIATSEGIIHYDTRNNQYQFYKLKVKPDPYGDLIWTIFEDQHHLYIGTSSEGLVRLNFQPETNTYGGFTYLNDFASGASLEHTEVFDICRSADGSFWLGTNRGLAKMEHPGEPSASLMFYKNNPSSSQSLSNNTVYKVFIDQTNILWCGTEYGLNKLDLNLLPFRYFTFKDPQAQDQVRSIVTTDGENIWLGTAKYGFYKFNIRSNVTQTIHFDNEQSPYNSHRSIYADQHNIWLGTLGGALRLNTRNPNASPKEINGSAVFAFLKDSRGNLWLGTNFGLYQLKPDGDWVRYTHNEKDPRSLSAAFVRSIYEDHNGLIWVGFETSGLSYLNPATGQFTRITRNARGEEVSGNIIFSLLEYPAGVIWAGSESGLNKISFSKNNSGQYHYSIKNFGEANGLSDKSVNGILADNKGFLWIGTIKGLLRFDIRNERFRNYLPSLDFSFSCAYKFNEHQLFFGSSEGFVMFDPNKVSQNDFLPRVVISSLRLFNKEVEIGGTYNGDIPLKTAITETPGITLGYRNNVFTLGFAGLHFSDPYNNTYAYRMVGFDKDWITAKSTDRTATYTNLDPGTYYFKVKAANSSGKWNETPVVLKVHIIPPPWRTWWAYMFYILSLALVIRVIMRYILLHSRQKHELAMEHKMRIKEEEMHQKQLSFFTNITHELQTPLTLINGSVERVVQRTGPQVQGKSPGPPYYLSLIHQQSSRLTYLVNQLLDFRKAEAGYLQNHYEYLDISGLLQNIANLFLPLCEEKKLDYDIRINSEILGWLDKDKLEKIVFNLLSNAFKHSVKDQQIIFAVSHAENHVEISVSNSGCELGKEELNRVFDQFFTGQHARRNKISSGIGLAFTHQLVGLLKGQITVSNQSDWIIFKATLPLLQEPPDPNDSPHAYRPSYLLRSIAVAQRPVCQLPAIENNKRALIAELEQQDKKTILIVEDEPAIRYLLKDLLSDHYIVYEAEYGRAALDLLRTTLPDLIISDIMMPEMSGLELCNKVKESSDTCHIPFILLSALGSVDHKTEGYDAGADAYISKPFDTQHLLVRVRKLLEYRERLHSLFKKDDFSGRIEEEGLVDGDKKFLSNLVSIIEDNLEETSLDAAFLEAKLVMSKMQLYRKLKALSNMAPAEFIKYIRLKKAAHLLQSTQLTVSEIFYQTGFNNQSYFFREFKKRYNYPPNEFRSRNRINAS